MAKERYEIDVECERAPNEHLRAADLSELIAIWEDFSTQSGLDAEENCALLASGEVSELEDANPDNRCTVKARCA